MYTKSLCVLFLRNYLCLCGQMFISLRFAIFAWQNCDIYILAKIWHVRVLVDISRVRFLQVRFPSFLNSAEHALGKCNVMQWTCLLNDTTCRILSNTRFSLFNITFYYTPVLHQIFSVSLWGVATRALSQKHGPYILVCDVSETAQLLSIAVVRYYRVYHSLFLQLKHRM